MSAFEFSRDPLDPAVLAARLADPAAGGYVSFEGWVRNHNEGHEVTSLEYEAYETLARIEGEKILAEARAQFGLEQAICVHRVGHLAIGEIAVWVGVATPHRDAAFKATRYPHLSASFRSTSTGQWKLGISAPIWPAETSAFCCCKAVRMSPGTRL